MKKVEKFQELNKKYHEFLLEELSGERKIRISELRQLAAEAGISDEVNLNGNDEEFLKSLKKYFKRCLLKS